MPEQYYDECKEDNLALLPLTTESLNYFDHILSEILTYAKNNNIDDVDYSYSINQFDGEKITLLELAIDSGIIDVVKEVLDSGANPNFKHDGMTALFYAVSLNKPSDIIALLIEHNADPNIRTDEEYGFTPLHYAIANKNIPVTNMLLMNRADPNLQDHYGKTALHHIMLHNFHEEKLYEIVNILLYHGAKINLQDDIGRTPIYYAIIKNKPDSFIKYLIRMGADIDLADNYYITPLMIARNNNSTV